MALADDAMYLPSRIHGLSAWPVSCDPREYQTCPEIATIYDSAEECI